MSSKRRLRRKACDGKVRFTNLDHARRMIRVRKMGLEANAYKCPHCRGWHIGHRPGAGTRRALQCPMA